MQQLRLNDIHVLGSTKCMMALWSLFFLTLLCVSCSDGGESEDMSALFGEIDQMRHCQQKAENRDFYLHKYQADKIIGRYESRYAGLSAEKQRRFTAARCRYTCVWADYLVQIGNRREAREVMDELAVNTTLNLNADTVLWLDYLCHYADVNFRSYNIRSNSERILRGYDCLVQCYILSSRCGYSLYKATSMKLLSRYLLNDSIFTLVKQVDPASVRYMNEESVADSMLAGNLAERALCEFLYLNDPYQTADAWRNYASCFFAIGNSERSVACLHNALANPAVDSIPALKANIMQQMSMSYAAQDDKHLSDKYRNEYLDIQESIRQDRQYEARAIELSESISSIVRNVAVALSVFLLLCVLTVLLNHLRKKRERKVRARNSELEQLEEQVSMERLRYSDAQRAAVEQRARMESVRAMLSLIDRLQIATEKGQLDYAEELTDGIVEQNEMLTHWVKLRKGIIAPKIETFPVQALFSILAQNKVILSKTGITLDITATEASVKADRILTIFILNTLVDNAKKAVAEGKGRIAVECHGDIAGGYAEITVTDNGVGMTEQQTAQLFENKPIANDGSAHSASHGFGLQNCRGIIERYKKLSRIYSVCTIWARSAIGKGTTIGFRLPLAVKMLLLCLCIHHHAAADSVARYADSIYNCNLDGRYEEAVTYADSCDLLQNRGTAVDSTSLLSVYNETAVAALALHDWNRYLYYNYRYAALYQEYTADRSLPDYCERLERNKQIANVAMFVSLLLLLALIPIFWFFYLRHVFRERKDLMQRIAHQRDELAMLHQRHTALHIYNNVTDNQLSTLKHETMYYPSRIRQMIASGSAKDDIEPVVGYYAGLYDVLLRQLSGSQPASTLFPVSCQSLSYFFPSLQEDITVVANKELMDYLQQLLKRHNGGEHPLLTVASAHDSYCTVSACMRYFDKPMSAVPLLFTASTCDVDFLIMRQILRETGSACQCYVCGISACADESGAVTFSIILPCR